VNERPPRGGILAPEYLALTVAMLSTIALAAFDAVAVIAMLPRITSDLGDVELISWVITAFLLASTIAVIVAGPVIDALGLRATFRSTLVLFAVTSVACALAPSVPALVGFRLLQGVGGGLVVAVGVAAVPLVYPQPLLPRAYAANSLVWGGMAIAGPAVAAGLVALVSWRAVFLVNLPLCAAAALLAWNRFPGPAGARARLRFDWTGTALIAGFTSVSLLGLSAFGVRATGALVAAVVLAGLYWRHTGRVSDAVLERRFFARMPLSALHLAAASTFGACLGLNAYLPLYVEGGLGRAPGIAASSVLFFSAGWSVGSIAVSRLLDRFTAVATTVAGFVLVLAGLAVGLASVSTSTPLWLVYAFTTVEGVGVGFVSTSLLTLLQRHIDGDGVGRANSAHQYARNLAYTYSAALSGAVVLAVVQYRVGDLDAVQRLLDGTHTSTAPETAGAIASGFRLAHAIALGVVAGGLLASSRLARWIHRSGRAEPSATAVSGGLT
jgi:MFS family permease